MMRRTAGVIVGLVAVFGVFAALDGQVPREAGTWSPAGALAGAREGAASVLLPDGRVLVLGGRSADGPSTSTEVYAGGAWTAADAVVQRWGHTATVLGDGRVLIAGGEDAAGLTPALDIYNPADGTLTPAGALSGPRKGHAATLLLDGRVLIAGGFDGQQVVSTVEVVDAEAGSVSAAPFTLTAARAGLSATTLIDGRVLLAGGNNGTDDLALVEVVNVTTGSVTVRAMSAPRRDHRAVLLPHNNHVLLVGGMSNGVAAGTELYRSWTAEFVATAAPLAARLGAAAAPLADEGWALVAGGAGVASAERYAFATVTTDKDDYSPGEKVYVSGSGWQPNEELTLSLRELPAEHDSRTFTLTADGSGRLVNVFLFDVESHHAGVRFYLTARGAASQAQITFTDGTVRVRTAGTGGTASSPASLVSWVLYSNTTCDPGVGDANVLDSDSIVAGPTGNGTNIPVDVPATKSLRLTASAISGFVFSTWANGNFTTGTFTPTSNPGCIVGDNSAQNTRVEYVAIQNRPTTTGLARTTGSNPSTYGDTVTFTATVTGTGGNPNGIGTVTFKLDGSTVLCSAVPLSGNTAACSPSRTVFRVPGSHTVTAEYSGGVGGTVQFGASSGVLNHTILAKQVSGIFTAANKTYDGTNAATINTRDLQGDLDGDVVTLTGGTATFADKNVGNGKTVTATGFTLSGADAVGYSLAPGPWTTTANITAATAAVSVTGNNKVYDDTTAATLTCAVTGGVVSGDTVTCTAAGAFADQHVGNDKTVSISTVTLGGGDAGNYVVGTTPTTATANITPASATVTVTGTNKTYDGTTAATLTCSVSGGLFTGDAVTCTAAGAFANKHAGTGKTIDISGVTLAGADSGNYAVSGAPTTATADIAQKSVTGSFTAVDKVYDGNATASVTDRAVDGKIAGDLVELSGGAAAFDNKNVGTDKPVTLTGAALAGDDAANYTLTSVAQGAADITALGITGNFTAADKVYDGTVAATVNSRSLSGHVATDDVALDGGTATFNNKNVGVDKPVTLAGATLVGADAGNYTLSSVAQAAADITRLTITGSFTAADKIYDGNTTAEVLTYDLTGEISGDDVALTGTGASFDDKHVGVDKTVTLGSGALQGADAGNYTLGTVAQATADITPLGITGSFTAANKVYDGTAAAMIVDRTLAGTISGDSITMVGGTAAFDNRNVGTGKTVTASGFTLAGTDAPNYTLAPGPWTTAANITAKPLTGHFTVLDKVYDATVAATVVTRSLEGVVGDGEGLDSVEPTGGTAAFADKNVGTGKVVTLTGAVLAGADAGNYTLTMATATASISAKGISGTFTAADKIYDGLTNADVTGRALVGAIAGDSVALSGGVATFATKDAGMNKVVTLSGATLTGGDAGNYQLLSVAAAAATISPKGITGGFTAADKVVDGTTAATITSRSLVGVIAPDVVSLVGGTAVFADANVGPNKVVTGSGFSLAGADAHNYSLVSVATTTASIVYAPTGAACLGAPGRTILQPINTDGFSVFKQGSTVPAKFRVCDASGNSIGTPGVVTDFRLVETKMGTVTTSVNEEVISTAADPAFRWSADGMQWIFNINTKKLSTNHTYVFRVWLNDGTSFTFQFGLK